MKYSFLLLIVCVFFFQCKEWEKKKIQPPIETFSLEKLFGEIRKIDTASEMLDFKPDSAIIEFNKNILSGFFPDSVDGLKGDVSSIIETVLTPQKRGNLEVSYTKEYFFENGRLIKFIDYDPADSLFQTMKYDATGLLVQDKKVNPDQSDSIIMEYQYDTQKKLNKILHFDGLNILVKTTHFFYHENGNLDSVFHENTEGEDLSYKYFTSSNSRSFLQLAFDSKGSIMAATFYRLDDYNRSIYDEQYRKEESVALWKYKYDYTSYGDLKQLESTSKRGGRGYSFKKSYPKRDSAGSWVERFTYVQGDLQQVSRRAITYKKPAP